MGERTYDRAGLGDVGWGAGVRPYYEEAGITIYHGDCREILPTLPKVDLVLTDPPYGIGLSDLHFGKSAKDRAILIANDHSQEFGVAVLHRFINDPCIVFSSPMLPWPGKWSQFLVWDKGAAAGGGGDVESEWKRTWELIQVRNLGVLSGSRDSAILRFKVPQHKLHPCEKPVSLICYLAGKQRSAGNILDPFCGSGTTLVAAKNLGRRAIGIEIEERYCEIAANRLRQGVLWGAQ